MGINGAGLVPGGGEGGGSPVTTSNTYTVYNVKNYGAAVDGVTDDTAAVQSALTALLTTGITLTPTTVIPASPANNATMTFTTTQLSNLYAIIVGMPVSGTGIYGYGIVETATVSGSTLTVTISGNTNATISTTSSYIFSFGGDLFIPAGICISQPFTLPSLTFVTGNGSLNSRLQLKAASNADFITMQNFACNLGNTISGATGFGFRNICIDGNGAAQTSGPSVCFRSYGYNPIIQDAEFVNGYTGGIYTSWTQTKGSADMEGLWEQTKIFNYGLSGYANGIEFHGPHDTQISDSVVATLQSSIKLWNDTNSNGYALPYGSVTGGPINYSGGTGTNVISSTGAANTNFTFTFNSGVNIASSKYPLTNGAFIVQLVGASSTTASPTWAVISYTGVTTVNTTNDTFTGCSCTITSNAGYNVRNVTGVTNISFPTYGLLHEDFQQVATPTSVTANSTATTITTVNSGGTQISNWGVYSPGNITFSGSASSFPIGTSGYGVVNINAGSGIVSCAFTSATGTGTVTLGGLIPLNGAGGVITTGTSTVQNASSVTFPTNTATATTSLTSSLGNITITASGNYTTSQVVYLYGFSNGIANGFYSVVGTGSGTVTVSNVAGPITGGTVTGTISPQFGQDLSTTPIYGTITGSIGGGQSITGSGLTSTTVAYLDPASNQVWLTPGKTMGGAVPVASSQYLFAVSYSAGGLQTNTMHIWGRHHICGYLGQAWWGSNNEWEGAASANCVFDTVNLGWYGGTIYGIGGSATSAPGTQFETGLQIGQNNTVRTSTFQGTIYQINTNGAAITAPKSSGANHINVAGDSNNPLYYIQNPFVADDYEINTHSYTQTNRRNINQTTTMQGSFQYAGNLTGNVQTSTASSYLIGGFNVTITALSGTTCTFTLTNSSATWPSTMWTTLGKLACGGFGTIYDNYTGTLATVTSQTTNTVTVTLAQTPPSTATGATGVIFWVPVSTMDFHTVILSKSATANATWWVGQPSGAANSPTFTALTYLVSREYQLVNGNSTYTIALTPADTSTQNTTQINNSNSALTIPVLGTAQSGATPASAFKLVSNGTGWYTC